METSEKVLIPLQNLALLQEKIAKLQKKATKLGLTNLSIEVGETSEDTQIIETPEGKRKRTIVFVEVTIIGQQIKLPGWNLFSVIEHAVAHEDGVNFNAVRNVPGYNSPVEYRTIDPTCDHCKTNRRRNETFVLIHDDGALIRVGRSCLKDFLGHQSPEAILNSASFLRSLDKVVEGFRGLGGYVEEYFCLDKVLNWTAMIIEKRGWLSGKKAQELMENDRRDIYATREVLWLNFNRENLMPKELQFFKDISVVFDDQPSDENVEYAQRAKEWILDREMNEASDFFYNCMILLKQKYITGKQFGFAAAIIGTYHFHTEKQKALQESLKSKKISQFVGNVKDKIERELKLEKYWTFPGYYRGLTYILKFVDADDNVFIWKTGDLPIDEGQTAKIKGTIKKHEAYNGVNQTVITRCKIL